MLLVRKGRSGSSAPFQFFWNQLLSVLITQRSVVQIHPPQPFTDLRDYRRSPQFPNHWIVAVSGLKFFRETSFALSLSCLLIAGGKTRSATRLLARRLVFSNAEP